MLTASKARPALTRAAASLHGNKGPRTASILASSDIFDNPGRLIFEDSAPSSAPTSGAPRRHSAFNQPPPRQHWGEGTLAHTAPAPSRQLSDHSHASRARQLSTLSRHRETLDGSTILLNGPACPRNPPRIFSRHASSSVVPLVVPDATKMSQGQNDRFSELALPEPVIFDGPARPPRKVPVRLRRSYDEVCSGFLFLVEQDMTSSECST